MPAAVKPKDFDANLSINAIQKRYHCCYQTAKKWLKEAGVVRNETRAMPPDFPQNANLSVKKLKKLYHCGESNVYRWQEQCGVAHTSVGAYHTKGDTDEQIRACLNCKKPQCTNCFERRR